MKKDMSRKETIIVLESMMMTAGTCRTEKEALARAIKDIKKIKKMKKEKEKLASVIDKITEKIEVLAALEFSGPNATEGYTYTGLIQALKIIDEVMKGENENEG